MTVSQYTGTNKQGQAEQREAALNLFISAVAAGKVEWKAETFAHDLIAGAEQLVRYVNESKTG